MRLLSALIIIAGLLSGPVLAQTGGGDDETAGYQSGKTLSAAIPSTPPAANNPHSDSNGWQVSLGLALGTRKGFIYVGEEEEEDGLFITDFTDIRYQHDNFFLALSPRDLSLGYTLWQRDHWALDTILSPKQTGFDNDNEALDSQDEQDIDLHLGGRLTRYGDNHSLALELGNDIAGVHSSYIASISYLREWPLRRWLISSQLSLSHLSGDVTRYYYGVDADEANSLFSAYAPGSATIAFADLVADYPLTQHWVFRATVRANWLSGALKRSPIVDDALSTDLEVGVFYVF